MVHGKAGVLPVDKAGGQIGVDERHSMDVAERDVNKLTLLIETALQHDAVVMRIPRGRPARRNSPADW